MTKLEKLEEFAYNRDYEIIRDRFGSEKKGACMASDKGSIILLNKARIENDWEQRKVLAKEMGHLETDTLYY